MEIVLPPGQIEHAYGAMTEAARAAFGPSGIAEGLYQPDQERVPRPSFNVLAMYARVHHGLPPNFGCISVSPAHKLAYEQFVGLRGIAVAMVEEAPGTARMVTGPAIILEGGTHLAILTTEHVTAGISDIQLALLETEYAKNKANISESHVANDITNAGDIAPALVIASSGLGTNAHMDVHALASANGHATFGENFSATGRQDFGTEPSSRRVRSAVVPVARAVFHVAASHNRLRDDSRLFGLQLSAGELAVGMTLVATASRLGRLPDLERHFINMIET